MFRQKIKKILTALGGILVISALLGSGGYLYYLGQKDMGQTLQEQTDSAELGNLISKTALWARGLILDRDEARVSALKKIEWKKIEKDYQAMRPRLIVPSKVIEQYDEMVKIITDDLVTAVENRADRDFLIQIDNLIEQKKDSLEIFLNKSPDQGLWWPQTSEIFLGLAGGIFALTLLLAIFFFRRFLFGADLKVNGLKNAELGRNEQDLKKIAEQTTQALGDLVHRNTVVKIMLARRKNHYSENFTGR